MLNELSKRLHPNCLSSSKLWLQREHPLPPNQLMGGPTRGGIPAPQRLPQATELTYVEFPKFYTWTDKTWRRRRRPKVKDVVSRLYRVHPGDFEKFLRTLLYHTKGPSSFEELKTVNGDVCETFQQAAIACGLAEDDSEWELALEEACAFESGAKLRELFSFIVAHVGVNNPGQLWNNFGVPLSEDFAYRRRSRLGLPAPHTCEERDFTSALRDIRQHLRDMGKVYDPNILPPIPDNPSEGEEAPDESHIDLPVLRENLTANVHSMNPQQKEVFQFVIENITSPRLCFVNATGGCDRTLQARFQAHLQKGSFFGTALLIVWDEASMVHRFSIECADRLLRDLTGNKNTPFGGIFLVFVGDFGQTLPIVRHGNRADTVSVSLQYSSLWRNMNVFCLEINERARARGDPLVRGVDGEDMPYSAFLIRLGNGTLGRGSDCTSTVRIPSAMLMPEHATLRDLIQWVYPEGLTNPSLDSSVLTTTNKDTHAINDLILSSGDYVVRTSFDSVDNDEGDYPQEFLNSWNFSGLPLHALKLRV